jgi:hypothetical protein
MAVGTVSTANTDNWALLSTQTVTSASSISFTGLSGYGTLLFTFNTLLSSTSGGICLRFNNDSGQNYAGWSAYNSSQTDNTTDSIVVSYLNSSTTHSGYAKVFDAQNTTVPKTTEGAGRLSAPNKGIWMSTSAVTSMQVVSDNGGAFTGTVSLYGLAV